MPLYAISRYMKTSLTDVVYMSLFTSLMIIGTVLRIPPAGPIRLFYKLFVVLSGFFWGLSKVLQAQLSPSSERGLPFFRRRRSGVAGPTGGYCWLSPRCITQAAASFAKGMSSCISGFRNSCNYIPEFL